MSRNLMPKSGAMAPYVVVNRDAAVAGVFSVDGERGAVDLTTKYVQITAYNQKIGTIEEDITTIDGQITLINQSIGSLNTAVQEHTTAIAGINTSIGTINTSLADKAAKGANNDILELNAITKAILISQGGTGVKTQAEIWPAIRPVGSTPLGGDPVNPYDATTKRWVENLVGAGATGPTMNGVMNYGVGTRELWQSRAYIPPFALPLDGQLVNRADWPELWAHAQMHGVLTDAQWIADPNSRAKYSSGNGTTTFRLPDINGVQVQGQNGFTGASSVRALYGRGDAGDSSIDGQIRPNGLPNITGSFGGIANSANRSYPIGMSGASGAFSKTQSSARDAGPISSSQTVTVSGLSSDIGFDASASDSTYGAAAEVRPNSFYGVWVVRASGGFTAANTSWSVINGDAAIPPNGTTSTGGKVISAYKANNLEHHKIEISSSYVEGSGNANTASLTTTTYNASGQIDKTTTADILTTEDNEWYYWNDARANEYLAYAGGITSTASELRVQITKRSIRVEGIIRKNFATLGMNLCEVKKLLPGTTLVSSTFTPALCSTYAAGCYTEPAAGTLGATSLVKASGATNTSSWIMVGFTFYFK